jgi:hypothetical protein
MRHSISAWNFKDLNTINDIHNLILISVIGRPLNLGHSELAPASGPSNGCPLLFSCKYEPQLN